VRMLVLGMSALIASAFAATPAHADEIFGGLYIHDVDTAFTIAGVEDGMDVQLGWRGEPLTKLRLQQYLYIAANTSGGTHYAAFGFSRKFGDKLFIRPGVGIAVHTGSTKDFQDESNDRLELGSLVLFAPELNIGARIDDRTTIEASWVHMSHGTLFSGQNPGMDNFGLRLSVRLP
jgi:lipid A 3-O-deacylase